jgi:hypothetical protein
MGTKFVMDFPNSRTEEWKVLTSNEQIVFMEKMSNIIHKKYLTMIIQNKVEEKI